MDDFYTRKDIDKSTVELTITVKQEIFNKTYDGLLQKELEKTDIKGFRKGKVPANLIEPQIENTLKIEAFEQLVSMYITTAIQKEALSPVAPPDYKEFPDFAKKEDLKFVVNITVMPEFKLGDLKKIKIVKEKADITEKEVNDALQNIFDRNKTEFKEINEEWAKEISKLLKIDSVKDLTTLKEHIKDALKHQKEHMLQHKVEDSILEQAVKLSEIEIPQKAIEYEAHEREHSFEHDMQSRGAKVEDFLKANSITIEKMRELWLKDAKEALETDAFLKTYVKERNIKATEEDVQKRIEDIKATAPAGTDQSIFNNEEWIEYIRKITQKDIAFGKLIDEVLKK